MSWRMKLSGSNIFWKNILAGLQEAVFLKPNAPRSVFLWRLGCNASRKIRLRGDCEADLAKLIAPRFFHLPKLAAPHSSSLGHIYHVGIIRIRALEDDLRQPFKHIRHLSPQPMFCTNHKAGGRTAPREALPESTRLTRGSPADAHFADRKQTNILTIKTDNRGFNHNRDFARTVKPAAGLLRGRLFPNPPASRGAAQPTAHITDCKQTNMPDGNAMSGSSDRTR